MKHLLSIILIGCVACISSSDSNNWDLQGHRGARGLAPENTIPSFIIALDLGVTTIELDLVVSADSQLIVSHEPWMNPVICSSPDGQAFSDSTGMTYNIFTMTVDEIQTYDCGSIGHPRFPHQAKQAVFKPRFVDAVLAIEMHAVEHGLPLPKYNIETKIQPGWDGVFTPDPETFTFLLHEAIVKTGIRDRSILQSFDVRTLQSMRMRDESIPLALLIENTNGYDWNIANLGFKPDIYSPYYPFVDATLRRQTRNDGILLIPWTVNRVDEMKALLALDVDGLITDYPDSARILRDN